MVDPGDSAPVIEALARYGLKLTAILVTHHHGDHVGGLAALQDGSIPVYGPRHESIAGITHPVGEGDHVDWAGCDFEVLDVPGHTRGHLAYFTPDSHLDVNRGPLVFVGDTLFSAGCGRLFDGSMDQLYRSLVRLSRLPDATRVCPAHEYTLGNLRFALAVEPRNPALAEALTRCEALRAAQQPTLPTTLAKERLINPFLRCTESDVIHAALQHGAANASPGAVFAALREWKNIF